MAIPFALPALLWQVLTIAHRLDTIMDSDRVAVLDNGKLVQFDTPTALLAADEDGGEATGHFAALVREMEEAAKSGGSAA